MLSGGISQEYMNSRITELNLTIQQLKQANMEFEVGLFASLLWIEVEGRRDWGVKEEEQGRDWKLPATNWKFNARASWTIKTRRNGKT